MSFQSIVFKYRISNDRRAYFQLITTLAAYLCALSFAIWQSNQLMLLIPAAFVTGVLAVRLYMLQHDCMHHCFTTRRQVDDLIGVFLSPFTLTPFLAGRHNHLKHHSHVGDLDHRDTFEINVLTVAEYRELSRMGKLVYRLYRSSFTLVLVGPFVVYAIVHRFPKNTRRAGAVVDVVLHNVMLGIFGLAVFLVAGASGVWVLLLSIWFGVSFGAVIPYVEHNFEDVHWGRRPDLDTRTAALKGSAVLDFGDLFHVVTANIGFHDLHHLYPTIPSYHLKKCYEALDRAGEMQSQKITLRAAIGCFRWKLWDEDQRKMVTFAAA